MPRFAFTVMTQSGQRTAGVLNAANYDAAMKTLADKELTVTRINPITLKARWRVLEWLGISRKGMRGEVLIAFTQQLAAMLEAGLPVKGAIDTMAEDTKDHDTHELLMDLSAGLGEGCSVTELMARHPSSFSPQYLAMVSAGESGGNLPMSLNKLAVLIESVDALKRKVKTAFYYPGFVVCFAFLVVIGIMTFGIPRFAVIYSDFGAQLPLPTRILIAIGAFLSYAWPYLLFCALALTAAFLRLSQTPRGRWIIDDTKLRLPVIGQLLRRLAISQFAATLSSMHHAGVPLVQSLELVGGTMGNVVMESAIAKALPDVLQGGSLSETLRRSGQFTAMALSMLTVGEQTGRMDVMLDKVATYYQSQVEITLRGLVGLVEPIIIVAVGLTVGSIILSLILPIFQLARLLM